MSDDATPQTDPSPDPTGRARPRQGSSPSRPSRCGSWTGRRSRQRPIAAIAAGACGPRWRCSASSLGRARLGARRARRGAQRREQDADGFAAELTGDRLDVEAGDPAPGRADRRRLDLLRRQPEGHACGIRRGGSRGRARSAAIPSSTRSACCRRLQSPRRSSTSPRPSPPPLQKLHPPPVQHRPLRSMSHPPPAHSLHRARARPRLARAAAQPRHRAEHLQADLGRQTGRRWRRDARVSRECDPAHRVRPHCGIGGMAAHRCSCPARCWDRCWWAIPATR